MEKFNCNPENNRNLIAIHKNGQDSQNISNETFITWVSSNLKLVTKEICKNAWKCLTENNKEYSILTNEAAEGDANFRNNDFKPKTEEELMKYLDGISEGDDENTPEFQKEMLDFYIEIEDGVNMLYTYC